MLSGDCNVCINGKLPPYSATCTECGLSRKNFKTISNADRVRSMTDEELLAFLNERNACLRPYLRTETECRKYDKCEKCWLDWLKREATQ